MSVAVANDATNNCSLRQCQWQLQMMHPSWRCVSYDALSVLFPTVELTGQQSLDAKQPPPLTWFAEERFRLSHGYEFEEAQAGLFGCQTVKLCEDSLD